MRRKRALTTEGARAVRQKGYDDALEFALAIGLSTDYKNDPQAKKDVIDAFGDNLEVCNSRAISAGQMPEQKVLLRYNGKNLGELEMRTDSEIHYREVKFSITKPKAMEVLLEKIPLTGKFNDKVLVYGNTPKRFGRWNIDQK